MVSRIPVGVPAAVRVPGGRRRLGRRQLSCPGSRGRPRMICWSVSRFLALLGSRCGGSGRCFGRPAGGVFC